ncbi:MAG: hypothetical protein ACPLN0_06910 [Candidatus Hydrothermia bacterium]
MKKLLVFLSVPFFSGCFFGTFRSAEPIGAGNVEKNLYFNVPFYYSRSYKEGARTSGTYYTGVGLGAMLNFGASDFMDFGAKLDLAEGLGPQWKFRFIHYYPLSMAINTGFGYHFVAEGFCWNVDLLASSRISEYSSVYMGFLIHHLPDYTNVTSLSQYFNIKSFRNFAGFALGFSFSNFEKVKAVKSFDVEFVIPVHKYPPLLWGLSVGF